MNDNELLLLTGDEIVSLFKGQELAVLQAIEDAYKVHDQGDSTLPHSSFIRFPGMERERIIALPSYLGGGFEVAGIKWIASFPNNLQKGMERASAALILNSMETGRPRAIMESSVISAKRTAASAALAAKQLWQGGEIESIGLIGCGLINFETLRFLLLLFPSVQTVHLHDLSQERAELFRGKVGQLNGDLDVVFETSFAAVAAKCPILALATTAVKPHIDTLPPYQKGAVFLHVSLRDFTPEVILQADNIVDDVDHVLRAQTSVHLTEQQVGHRDFIRGTLGGVLRGNVPEIGSEHDLTIFNPFGMGVLDLALADLVYRQAKHADMGTVLPSFFPSSWLLRAE